ncbi:unnamed protein product [Phytophthora fragariaefolia]|uniref:Unnamed protein product n=1 Tax=Phytophthora fragariaefolia TaxID=1490495 RepID=A0A9W6XK86_9STRA|nr:unnamed protein product [Phytophthora fragariaefolia]
MECQPSRRLSQHDYDDDESDYNREAYSDSEGGSDHDYIDAGLADEKRRGMNAREDSTRSQKNSTRTHWSSARPQGSSNVQWNSANQPADTTSRAHQFTDRRDNYGRALSALLSQAQQILSASTRYGSMRIVPALRTTGQLCHRECRQSQVSRRPPGPLRVEQFKLGGPPTLTGLDEAGLPQSAEPVAEAKYIFAYVGKAGWPERVWMDGNDGSTLDGIDGELVYSKEESRAMISNAGAARLRKGAMGMAKTMKLLPGVRLGWWSAQKFDRRVRMRALVMGAVNDQRSKIWLDTEANISGINATFARKLRLKWQARRDVQIGVQGIGKDKVGTSTRAWVKITLGWEVSYEFEVWVMDHHAGVDLILGTDFMIPAGIRLDLYNLLAKLSDEVVLPLIKSLNSAGDPKGGLQITDGPTETICLPGRVTAEFRARSRQPAESTHELWHEIVNDMVPSALPRVELGSTPPEGFVRLSSAKYRDWQVLAYETAIDKGLLRQLYDEWMERQPPAVERRAYSPPTKIARRPLGETGNADGENYGQTVNLASGPETVTRGRPEADDRSRCGENSADAVGAEGDDSGPPPSPRDE